MRWTPGGESSDIEDRRDDSGGGGGGFQFGGMHLGIGGVIILLILSVIFKTNLFSMLGGGGSPEPVPASHVEGQPRSGANTASATPCWRRPWAWAGSTSTRSPTALPK